MQKNYNENLVAGAAIRDDKGRRISKLFESPHPKMTVGYAKNLIMPDDPTEQEFNFRQAGGGVIEDGVAVIDKVKGNSVVWNQLVNKVFPINISENSLIYINVFKAILRHKYVFVSKATWATQLSLYSIRLRTTNSIIANVQTTAKDSVLYSIFTIGNDNQGMVNIYNDCDSAVSISSMSIIDLTHMFGVGNEPSTYEEFLSRKPKVADEYAYNEGTIVNNKVEKVVTTGRNLWDEQWELGTISWTGVDFDNNTRIRSSFVPIFANKTYYLRCGSVRYEVFFYDANKSFISYSTSSVANGTFTTPNGAVYLRFTTNSNYTETTYNHDICINLSDPTINGQYFPYEKHELDLSWVKDIKDTDGVKLFEDGMKSAGSAFDEVKAKVATKRIGVKVFDGTEDWASSNGMYYLDDYTLPNSPKVLNSICNTYSFSSKTAVFKTGDDHTYGLQPHGAVVFNDSTYTGVTAWKSHLADLYAAGTPLVVYYELAEPIEVEYDEKNLTCPVIAGGTEEAIASEPSTAFRADIGYGIDAVKTILDLKARVEALEGK